MFFLEPKKLSSSWTESSSTSITSHTRTPKQMDSEPTFKQETPQAVETSRIDVTETIGGSQTRKYLNEHITPALLRGMRLVARTKPDDPLRFLGEFLVRESDQKSSDSVGGGEVSEKANGSPESAN
ncbi:LAMI_0H02872g1_1 [Lachancea mirantina]|uniref:LAMI_0H02872g1_1 n=1 Tax=Lachancea mirantina TaxID=1230905 RepID=A0A1G4KE20_9SACH|nr:LAMI_0H02872g1_1 [Lachancea mirantina]